ncbi:uncharacterized protein LOC111343903 [Stylophora pistillata]|uniref:uncharacterized protein LOC111343903 n=1 Tax=Stylophora pistillata TaxID=50429 RepID=UPI000C045350|nr:uncharacterized protein LOC111343903 [Stylophora pistillata]
MMDFQGGLFEKLGKLQYLDLSYNRVSYLDDNLFSDRLTSLEFLFLQHNNLQSMTGNTFKDVPTLRYLLLSNNNITVIPEGAFKNNLKLEMLVLNDNEIGKLEKHVFGFDENEQPPDGVIIYMIRTNVPELNLESFYGIRNDDSHELTMNDELIGIVRFYTKRRKTLCRIYLNPNASNVEMVSVSGKIYERARLDLLVSFLNLGFEQIEHFYDAENITHHYKLLPCPEGTYSLKGEGCKKCPPGGFLSDSAGYVADQCLPCPRGAYVKLDIYPGTRYKHCRACPRGTNTDSMAGKIACHCLEGFHRTHIFGKCTECERGGKHEGLDCKTDFLNLKPGYWWEWQNETHRERFRNFSTNLINPQESFDDSFRDFTYPMPRPTKCPREESCQGGVNAIDNPCKPGYEGPVCGICQFGYYKQLQVCSKCPTKKTMAIQLGLLAGFFLFIVAILVWYSRKKTKKAQGRPVIDIIFARLKIIIGFYQVTYGLLEAFSFVRWPNVLEDIAKYSELLQLNLLQIAPLHCLFSSLHVDAFGSLYASMGLNACAIAFFAVIFGVRYVMVTLSNSLTQMEKAKRISHAKELVYRNLFFFLFVTYLSTCSKTANVLPLACRRLCRDKEESLCDDYLKADYGIRCHGTKYHLRLIGAYLNIIYIIALPAFSITVLWRERLLIIAQKEEKRYQESLPNKEIVTGLRFLYENYDTPSWYWELIEMARKITLTSGLILIGQESRAYVGATCVLAGLYGMMFAYIAPIQDYFENKLMVTALSVTFINLGIGAVSRIPSENREPFKDPLMDTEIFKITVLGANTLVVGQLVLEYFSYILRFLKNWIKNPHFSLACFQSLLLPVNDLREDDEELDDKEYPFEEGKMELVSIHSDSTQNEDKILSSYPMGGENKVAFSNPIYEEMKDDPYAIIPVPLDMNREKSRKIPPTVRFKDEFAIYDELKEPEPRYVNFPAHEHLVIDVIPEENENKGKDENNGSEMQDGSLEGKEENDQEKAEEGEGKAEEEEEEMVEMCDQEVQTDLMTLEMDEETLHELFGEPQDESLFAGLPEDLLSDVEGSIDQQDEAEADLEIKCTPEAEDPDSVSVNTCVNDKENKLSPEPEIGEENKAFSSDWSISHDSAEVSVPETRSAPQPEVVGRENKAFASNWSIKQNKEEATEPEVEYGPGPELGKENNTLSSAL